MYDDNHPRDVKSLFRLAKVSIYMDSDELALSQLTLAETLSSSNLDLHALITIDLVALLSQQNRFAEAHVKHQNFFQKLNFKEHPLAHTFLLCSRGKLRQDQADFEGAQADFDLALKQAERLTNASITGRPKAHLADLYYHQGSLNYAEQLMRAALPELLKEQDLEQITYFLGVFGQITEAYDERQSQYSYEQALLVATQIGYKKYQRKWNRHLGLLSEKQKNYRQAYLYYEKQLEAFTEHSKLTLSYPAAMVDLARAAILQGDDEVGRVYADRAISKSAGDAGQAIQAEASFWFGRAALNKGEWDEAEQALKKAAASAPVKALLGDQINRFQMQIMAASPARSNEFEQAFERALTTCQSETERAFLYIEHSKQAQKQLDFRSAILDMKKAVEIFENQNEKLLLVRFQTALAHLYIQSGQGSQGKKSIDTALGLVSSIKDVNTHGEILSNAGIIYMDYGAPESALGFLKDALDLARQNPNPILRLRRSSNLIYFYIQSGLYAEAEAELQKIRPSFVPGSDESLLIACHQAELSLKQGQLEKAQVLLASLFSKALDAPLTLRLHCHLRYIESLIQAHEISQAQQIYQELSQQAIASLGKAAQVELEFTKIALLSEAGEQEGAQSLSEALYHTVKQMGHQRYLRDILFLLASFESDQQLSFQEEAQRLDNILRLNKSLH